jgi:ribosomal protein S18 acetylase RimI-like enzyme
MFTPINNFSAMSMTTKGKAYDNLTVTAAEKADSQKAAELIYLTGEGLFKYLFFPDRDRTIAVLRHLFEMENNDFSHKHAYIVKLDRQIAGLIVFMDRNTLKKNNRKMGWKILKVMGLWPLVYRLPRFIQVERLIPKLADLTLYINHIAIFNEFRGRGIATHLLHFCEKQAEVNSLARLALDVEVVNDTAQRVYEQFGFQKTKKIESKALKLKFGFRGLYRMQKEI